jgi:hypothetical protein
LEREREREVEGERERWSREEARGEHQKLEVGRGVRASVVCRTI